MGLEIAAILRFALRAQMAQAHTDWDRRRRERAAWNSKSLARALFERGLLEGATRASIREAIRDLGDLRAASGANVLAVDGLIETLMSRGDQRKEPPAGWYT